MGCEREDVFLGDPVCRLDTRARALSRGRCVVCSVRCVEWVFKRAAEEAECVAEVECVCAIGQGECPSLHLVAPTQWTAQTRREGRPL